jgi:DNA polymerase-3 subunit delta'
VDGFLTVGHPAAVAAVHAMLGSSVPHAVLISGPSSVGKLTLALDLARGLLCTGADGADRPCGICRGCRMVEHGNHGDLHLLAPSGAGMQIKIGDDLNPEPGSVRHLISELVLLPVEGGQRVAVIRDADRMGDDAQGALLKTLEEPPPGTTIVLCADDEERLLPTIRSRCARLRLGIVRAPDVERLLATRGLADAPTAARLARITGGRPGLAVAYAAAPEAVAIRGELTRTLLDLLAAGPAARLSAAKTLQARAGDLAQRLEAALAPATELDRPQRTARGRAAAQVPDEEPEAAVDDDEAETPAKATAKDRRRATAQLLEVWRDLARDLVLAGRGARRSLRDPELLEELDAAALALPPRAAAEFLARIAEAESLVKGNVTPELLVDVLLVQWPSRQRVA